MIDHRANAVAHRILIVDDNPSIHEDFRKILCPSQSKSSEALTNIAEELFGDVAQEVAPSRFEVDSAFQGQEALAKIEEAEREGRPFSLAFMDVRMPPGWDGVETISQIWKEHPQIQVVICTAYSDYSWGQILAKLGETDSLVILKKPFDSVEVLQLAHTLTKKWTVTGQANARMADLDEMVRQRTRDLVKANRLLQDEIQQRSLVEAALRESEQRFHQAFEAVSVALVLRPLESGGCIDVNQCFITLSGYSKEELLEQKADELVLLEESPSYAEALREVSSGKPVRNLELVLRRKDGEKRQTIACLELLKLGDQSCLLIALVDVTDQRQLEAQLRHAQKMEAIGQLAAGVAHDFNNLLTIIHGYASLQLAKRSLDTDVAKAFTQVKQASERAAGLTRQLLAFSRKQIVQLKPVELSATIRRAEAMLARVLGASITLECRLAADLPQVVADESHIDQVIMNLALNARDAMPKGGKLTISTEQRTIAANQISDGEEKRAGQFVVLSVADTGCGMDRQTMDRIFEPFFTTKPVGSGTGLGLSTVYGILKQHEGWVEVQSEVGRGTTFRAFLPVPSNGAKAGAQPKELVAATSRSATDGAILVVEDEPDVREFISAVLSEKGYEILQANSGPEALLKSSGQPHRIRLLLTDMVMPDGVNGATLAKRLLQRDPEMKVVYTSGFSADVVANAHALREGLNFLPKPFTREQLLVTIETALASRAPTVEISSARP